MKTILKLTLDIRELMMKNKKETLGVFDGSFFEKSC